MSMEKLTYGHMNGGFGVNIERCDRLDCIVATFVGKPESFDQIKKIARKLYATASGLDGRHNMILDFSSIDLGVEHLRFFFDQLKQTIEETTLEWCSVSPRQMEHYLPKGLNYVMKQEKPVFQTVDEAKGWLENIVKS
jgi:hypothetical protein